MPGRQGRVSTALAATNRVRSEPSTAGAIIGEIPAGEYFDVLVGPECAHGQAWFQVRTERLEGWMAEGSADEYWVQPILTDAQNVSGPNIELPGFEFVLPEAVGSKMRVSHLPYDPETRTPPVSLAQFADYPLLNANAVLYVYPVEDYLYYRSDQRAALEQIRTAINTLLTNPFAQVSLPSLPDSLQLDDVTLAQAGAFKAGFGLHAVARLRPTDGSAEPKPYYVFFGYSSDMKYLIFTKLDVNLNSGQLAQASTSDFTPSLLLLDEIFKLDVPDKCEMAAVSSANLAYQKPARASASLSAEPPAQAVDGNNSTAWNAGSHAPQWIEIDLGQVYHLTEIRLMVGQWPEGDTVHRIQGRSADGDFVHLHTFRQKTSGCDWLIFTPELPIAGIQVIRIDTLSSPSWVAWSEIQVYGEAAPAPADVTVPPAEKSSAPIAVGFFIAGVGNVPTGVLLGSAQPGRWLSPAEVSLRGGEIYHLYSAEADLGTAQGSAPYSQPPHFLSDQLIDLTPAPQAGQAVVAIGGGWNALPRPFQVLSNEIDLYREIVEERLQANGLADSEAQVHQVLRVDLDGNGTDEVLIAAAHFANRQLPVVTAGDYSLLILRTVVTDTVVSIPLVENYFLADEAPAAANRYTAMAILDLNGDGRMEIVVRGERYEGQTTVVYEVKGDTRQAVLLRDAGSYPAAQPVRLPSTTPTLVPSSTGTPIFPSIESFVGIWHNSNPNLGGWPKIVIAGEDGFLFANIRYACELPVYWDFPKDCELGLTSTRYSGNPVLMLIDDASATYNFTLSLNGDILHVTTFTDYTDNSSQADSTFEADYRKEVHSFPVSERIVFFRFFDGPAHGHLGAVRTPILLVSAGSDQAYTADTAADLGTALALVLLHEGNEWISSALEIVAVTFREGHADMVLQGEYFGESDEVLTAARTQILLTVFANPAVQTAAVTLNGDTIGNLGVSNSTNAKPANYVYTRAEMETYLIEHYYSFEYGEFLDR
jgi:hypothetical protein